MLEQIYQWGAVISSGAGLAYGVAGIVKSECPFIGRGRFADSFITRFFSGVAIGCIWPVFIPFAVWWEWPSRSVKTNAKQ